MNKENMQTPKNTPNTKRLGLSWRSKNSNSVTKTPQTDSRIHYSSLEDSVERNKTNICSNDIANAGTPCNSALLKQTTASTGGSHANRLPLSKRFRQDLRKKRLEFRHANDLNTSATESEPITVAAEEQTLETETNEKVQSREELMERIKCIQSEIKERKEHAIKVNELKQEIAMWKLAFNDSLNDLQQLIKPHEEKPNLLQQLNISSEMMKHIND